MWELAPFDFAPLARRYAQDERDFSRLINVNVRLEPFDNAQDRRSGAKSKGAIRNFSTTVRRAYLAVHASANTQAPPTVRFRFFTEVRSTWDDSMKNRKP